MSCRQSSRSITRREALGAAAAVAAGTLAARGADGGRPASFGKAKRVICLYLYGAAAQHETWDPKPDAPLEIRGKFQPISTAVPGVQICEHLPKVAKLTDRLAIVRSMTHPYNIHSAAYTFTGIDKVDIPMELNPFDSRHWPSFGSVMDYLAQQGKWAASQIDEKPAAREIPLNLALPFRFSARSGEFTRGGPYGGFLGRSFDPVSTDYEGPITGRVERWSGSKSVPINEPYLGIPPEGKFVITRSSATGVDLAPQRLENRRALLQQIAAARADVEQFSASRGHNQFRDMAYRLLTSSKLTEALDLGREPVARREAYGMNLFGQGTLAARRLIEAGASLVTVYWDEIDIANSAWDTHYHHYERLQGELLPGLDSALSSLLVDLEERGLLDDTLVLCLTEHGRTPKLHDKGAQGVGREHWSDVYSNVLAGAGIKRGMVVGSSDKHGAFVQENPISPKDILCTIYHLLGIDHHQTIPDRLDRPFPLVSGGRVIEEMLA